jgi:GDP-4-dehydro-6-deoxy-D-mannose reductase
MNKQVLIAGINGFVGHHVAKQLNERNISVVGIGNQPNLQEDLYGKVDDYISCDLTNPADVARIKLRGISAIINLAGFAKVGDSRGQGELYSRVNVGVHTTLYQECLDQGASPRIIAVSTGAVYDPNQPMPITEDSDLITDNETNEYVISKKNMEQEVTKFNQKGLHCIIARPFNHTGPGQLPGFLLPDLYEQLMASQKNGTPLMVGNLETKRDFTDVRDVARAYINLALADGSNLNSDIYNICSGKSIQGKTVLAILAEACGIDNLHTQVDESRLRANDVMDIYGSNSKLKEDTAWQQTIEINQTIQDFVKEKQSSDRSRLF